MNFFVFFVFFVFLLQSSLLYSCPPTCDLALASYYVTHSTGNLTYVGSLFNIPYSDITPFNPQLTSPDSIIAGQRIHIPLSSCDCSQNPNFLSHTVTYTTLGNDTYTSIAQNTYTNLTTVGFLEFMNRYEAHRIPVDVPINVTINCSCGDAKVSREYGLFETYPLREEDTLLSIAKEFGFTDGGTLIEQFNPGVNFTTGQGLLFIPTKDQNGSYRPLKSSKSGISGGAVAGIIIAVVFILLGLGSYLYFGVYKRKKVKSQLTPSSMEASILHSNASKDPGITSQERSASLLGGFTVDRSVEFSYEELARATDDFSMANKIGEGGFGAVYYAELRGEKAAIKKMDMEASKEFLAELNVLTHVHHLNLVRLIGYCVETSLFLVYEFIENGNLSQHLRGSDRDPLEWSARIQIALDSARGLEYIHEHTVPVYIHRDIKSANILLDRKFHAKVADFGLTKLTQAGGLTQQTRLVGTFGYMPPEYAQYGEVSPKIDVYAFGVVLYELISAKDAIVKGGGASESTGLVALIEEALSQPDPREHLKKLVDPRLGNNYSLDTAYKMAFLAKACTQENPQLRPSMRTIVVALMTLSSTTEDWDVGAFYEDHALVNLMSGR